MKVSPGTGFSLLAAASMAAAACSSAMPAKPGPPDGSVGEIGDPNSPTYCGRGQDVVGVVPPEGFCVRYFAQVGEARSLALAPNGDLFVGAPGRSTNGDASGGPGAVVVLSDDNHDGIAEQATFAGELSEVHAVVVADGYVYFTTAETVWRTPYASGQRAETKGKRENLHLPASYASGGRWTHGLARTVAGQLITSRGEYGQCGLQQGGEVSGIGANGALTRIAGGFRNPMYVRCHGTAAVCAATELGEDLTPGAREKLIMLRPDTTYGYPCCTTTGMTMPANTMGTSSCGVVTREDASFALQDTPFGFDWEPGVWPAPYRQALFVALHGSAYSAPRWKGARIVYAKTDPMTHAPTEDWQDFLGGFGPDGTVMERPTDIVFAGDGRMFFADDNGGSVFWMAPKTLTVP